MRRWNMAAAVTSVALGTDNDGATNMMGHWLVLPAPPVRQLSKLRFGHSSANAASVHARCASMQRRPARWPSRNSKLDLGFHGRASGRRQGVHFIKHHCSQRNSRCQVGCLPGCVRSMECLRQPNSCCSSTANDFTLYEKASSVAPIHTRAHVAVGELLAEAGLQHARRLVVLQLLGAVPGVHLPYLRQPPLPVGIRH